MKNLVNILGPMELNKNIIDRSLFTIVIDGGLNHQVELDNSLSLGDQDSSNHELDQVIPSEKDFSDLSYGLRHIPNQTEIVNCYGLLGGRLDHQLCVIGDILDYTKTNKTQFNLYSNMTRSVIILPKGEWNFPYSGNFSVLSLKEQKVKIFGDIKYKLEKEYTHIKPLSSHTLSNEAFGSIKIINEFPISVYLNYEEQL